MGRHYKRGRGAQINTHNRFEERQYLSDDEYREFLHLNGEDPSQNAQTQYLRVFPKTIVNKVDSPDIGRSWSMNPYQGCEHGCTYCYARNSHEYWGYSAGSEFEQVILVKENAPQLLEKTFQKRSWEPAPIMLSGNTDCYQPAEKRFGITRQLLEVLWKYRHPVGIITKNALIQRDVDILKNLSQNNLVHVNLSITTLDEKLRRVMEPRTASVKKRLQTVKKLAESGIPVNVMFAPVIPGLNSHEAMSLAREVARAGASTFNYTVVRLNGAIGEIFMNWAAQNFPDRAEKIKHQIEACHGGQLNDSAFGRRIRGEGQFAGQIRQTVHLARKKYFANKTWPEYNTEAFVRAPKGQFRMF